MWLNKCLATKKKKKKNAKFQILDIIYTDIGIGNIIFM